MNLQVGICFATYPTTVESTTSFALLLSDFLSTNLRGYCLLTSPSFFILPRHHILFIFSEHASLHVEFLPPRILTFPRFMNSVFLFSESIFDLLTFNSLLSSLVVTDYDFKLVPQSVSLTQIEISQSNFV